MTEDTDVQQTDTADGSAATAEDSSGYRPVEWYVHRVAVAALLLGVTYVGLRFYWSATAAIRTWVPREHVELLTAVFNLAVLLVLATGLSYELRRLRD